MSSAVLEATDTSALVRAVIARAARLVTQGDTVAAVFDVRRAYIHAGEKERHVRRAPRQRARRHTCLARGRAAQSAVWYSTSSSVLGRWAENHQLFVRRGHCVALLLP